MRKTVEDMHQLAKNKNIAFLSKEYIGVLNKHQWQCNKCSHIWEARPHNIRNGPGSGCPRCAGKAYTIEDMKALAKRRGFKLISTEFNRVTDKYIWECNSGHQWITTAFHIRRGANCRYCTTPLNEEKCRFIFESLTTTKFPKTRTVLHNRQELDGYSSILNLAFEYQGIQHYKTIYFHTPKRGLKEQIERDNQKRWQCEYQNIRLIEIPYYFAQSDQKLEKYIRQQIQIFDKQIEWNKFLGKPSELRKIRRIAEELNQTCLSTVYRGDKGPVELKCNKCDYKWTSRAGNVKRRLGCPRCKHCLSHTLEEARDICSKKNLTFMSDRYERCATKYTFQCNDCKHLWKTSFHCMKRGKGCPNCRKLINTKQLLNI